MEFNSETNSKCPLMDTDADVIIAGMFPVHVEVAMANCEKKICGYQVIEEADTRKCIKINKSGITWSEAMIETIRKINKDNQLLPHVKLGYIICDSYNNIDRALDISLTLQSLRHVTLTANNNNINLTMSNDNNNFSMSNNNTNFTMSNNNNNLSMSNNNNNFTMSDNNSSNNNTMKTSCSCRANATRTIIGVIGGASSKISQSINYIMNVHNIPQISYSSTSPALSDKFNFRTFFRTIPPDTYQGKALADIIEHFNWTYVSTVASSDDYGRLGIRALKESAQNLPICFAFDGLFDNVLSLPSTKKQIAKIISALKADKKSNVIVLFCEWPGAQAVLQEAVRQNLTGKTWIASEAWGDHPFTLRIREDVIGGMIGIIPPPGLIDDFKTHVRNINPRTHTTNSWFDEYFQQSIKCANNRNSSNGASVNVTLEYSFNKCAFVMDAVHALAYALHRGLKCSSSGPLDAHGHACLRPSSSIDPDELLHFLWNLTFTGALGVPLTFNMKGDPTGKFVNSCFVVSKKVSRSHDCLYFL